MTCYECGAEREPVIRQTWWSVHIDGCEKWFFAPLPAEECPDCGEYTVRCQDLQKAEVHIASEMIAVNLRGAQPARFIRKDLSMSRPELAKRLGVDWDTVFGWELGEAVPDDLVHARLRELVSERAWRPAERTPMAADRCP